jgi:predicted small lipoprotein YifL
MKNLFKLTLVALTLAITVAACGGDDKKGTDTLVIDSNVKGDTTIKVDTNATDTVAVDTAAKM